MKTRLDVLKQHAEMTKVLKFQGWMRELITMLEAAEQTIEAYNGELRTASQVIQDLKTTIAALEAKLEEANGLIIGFVLSDTDTPIGEIKEVGDKFIQEARDNEAKLEAEERANCVSMDKEMKLKDTITALEKFDRTCEHHSQRIIDDLKITISTLDFSWEEAKQRWHKAEKRITELENIPKTMEEITHIEGTHGGEF